MSNLFKNILDIFKVGNPKKDSASNDELTNEQIIEELSSHFLLSLKKESITGSRMLYPMRFDILIHPDDYEARKEYLPHIMPVIVAKFYQIISDNKGRYPDYRPAANYWYFQFSACDITGSSSGILNIEKGHITTIASLMPPEIGATGSSTLFETNTKVSLKLDRSKVINTEVVNKDALRGIDIVGEGAFRFMFDSSLNTNKEQIKELSSHTDDATANGLAKLTYSNKDGYVHYIMKDNLIEISSKNDTRSHRSIFKIDDDSITDSQVQIKYKADEKRFMIAAYGLTRLNERKLEESKNGIPNWVNLPNKSSIFINENTKVHFEIIK